MSIENTLDILEELHNEILEKAAHYWKNKDPKKYRQMLNKLKRDRKTPGHKERAMQEVLQAKRRERGGSGTTAGQNGHKGHSKGKMKSDTASAVKRHQNAEKKAGKKLSPDRKNNNRGYESGNVRYIDQKYNRGDEKYSKNAPELKKFQESPYADQIALLIKARLIELGKEDLCDVVDELFGTSDE